jgi:hypothetical protein
MDLETQRKKLIQEFGLEPLSEEDKDEMLTGLADAVQKNFLLSIYEKIGEEQFNALQASANMGTDFYNTTLKHLVPDYETLFIASRNKVIQAFKQEVAK